MQRIKDKYTINGKIDAEWLAHEVITTMYNTRQLYEKTRWYRNWTYWRNKFDSASKLLFCETMLYIGYRDFGITEIDYNEVLSEDMEETFIIVKEYLREDFGILQSVPKLQD